VPNFRVKYYYKGGKNNDTINAHFSVNEKEEEKSLHFPSSQNTKLRKRWKNKK
jgi:hypothetical protein